MSCRLFIARGQKEGQQFVITGSEARLGRAEGNDVVLVDPGVSNVHARILFRDGSWWAEDLASQNGTLLNGSPIKGAVALRTGDALALGSALVGFAETAGAQADRGRVAPQGVVSTGKLPTGEVLMSGLPQRRSVQSKSPGGDEVATNSGEGRASPFEDLDAEVTSPSGLALRADSGEVKAPQVRGAGGKRPQDNFAEHARAPAQERTAIDVPLTPAPDETEPRAAPLGPDDTEPKAAPLPRDARTVIGPPPERPAPPVEKAPVLVARPSAPRPSRVEAAAKSGPAPVPNDDGGPATVAEGQGRLSGPVLVPRPSGAKVSELETGPRSGSPVEHQPTVARAPLAPPPFEETRIHVLGTPNAATRPVVPTVPAPLPQSAAERARARRAAGQSLFALVAYQWKALPPRGRMGAAAGAGLLVLGGVLGLALGGSGEPRKSLPPEPDQLQLNQLVAESFGVGPGVDYERRHDKQFKYLLNAPTEAAVVVHLHAQDLGRDELVVRSNGTEVGSVSEDLGMQDRDLELLLPPRTLQRGAENLLAFENQKAAAGPERWRISHLRLEVIAIPPESQPGQALGEARRLAKLASALLNTEEVATFNVYKAWTTYRKVWITLLALPDDGRTELFADSRRKCDELARDLDQRCGALLLEAKKQIELKNPEKAREILDQVPIDFPGTEHRCQNLARQKIDEYEL